MTSALITSETVLSCQCGKAAVWSYGPPGPAGMIEADRLKCEDCVPRGCVCNRSMEYEVLCFHADEAGLSSPEFIHEIHIDRDREGREAVCHDWSMVLDE
jgi:hypothetical protein